MSWREALSALAAEASGQRSTRANTSASTTLKATVNTPTTVENAETFDTSTTWTELSAAEMQRRLEGARALLDEAEEEYETSSSSSSSENNSDDGDIENAKHHARKERKRRRKEIAAEQHDRWEAFYGKNTNRFFKERNYLHFQFPELRLVRPSPVAAGGSTEGEHQFDDWRNSHVDMPTHSEGAVSPLAGLTLCEIGCGTGATMFPLLAMHPEVSTYIGFDISETAVQTLQESVAMIDSRATQMRDQTDSVAPASLDSSSGSGKIQQPQQLSDIVHAFVFDIASTATAGTCVDASSKSRDTTTSVLQPDGAGILPPELERFRGTVDMALLVFVLSAIPPEDMVLVLRRIRLLLKPGGKLLLRDYGAYDMTQLRFHLKGKGAGREDRRLTKRTYVRADGTIAFFFDEESTNSMAASAGLRVARFAFDCREMRNRKRRLTMYRVWANAVVVRDELD